MIKRTGQQSHAIRRWILAGAMGMGLAVATPSFGQARRDTNERERVRERTAARDAAPQDDVEEAVKFADLPAAAQDTVNEQRKGREIVSTHRVTRDGRDFYRVSFAV